MQRGRPVVRGTRVTVDDSIIGELFPAVTVQRVKEILSYAAKHQANVEYTA